MIPGSAPSGRVWAVESGIATTLYICPKQQQILTAFESFIKTGAWHYWGIARSRCSRLGPQ